MTHTASFLKPRDRMRSRTKFKSFSENTDIRSRAPWEKKQCLNCKQMVILGLFSESTDLVHCMYEWFIHESGSQVQLTDSVINFKCQRRRKLSYNFRRFGIEYMKYMDYYDTFKVFFGHFEATYKSSLLCLR